ncbi:hypothetical protein JW906_00210 [bacterium]|nr:hypothetical protein [bacterium]
MKHLAAILSVLIHLHLLQGMAFAQDLPPVSFNNVWNAPFRPDPVYRNHFTNSNGRFLYVLNKTAWAFFQCAYPEKVLDNALKHGANVIRVCLEGTPYESELNLDLWPWGGTRRSPDWHCFNEDYLREVERRIRMAGEKGIGLDLVLYFDLTPDVRDIPGQKPYWDMVISRLGRYSNVLVFEIMNEETGNEAFQDSAGNYFRKHDAGKHPVCSSDGTTDDALWPHKTWMDLAVVHTCTGTQPEYDLEYWYLNVARNIRQYGKPAFNNETGRENRHRNNDPVHRRKQGWLFATAGAFWTWHSWDGCEGINDTSYFAAGWQFLKPMKDFFESLPFWRLQPNHTACSLRNSPLVHASLSSSDRTVMVMYCCSRESGKRMDDQKAFFRIADGEYLVQFLSPADLREIGRSVILSGGLKNIIEMTLPDFTDDLIVKITLKTGKERTLMEGTM